MKNTKIVFLLALLTLGGATLQAQQSPETLEEFRKLGDTLFISMTSAGEHEVLALATMINENHVAEYFLQRRREDGELLSSVRIWSNEFLERTLPLPMTEVFLPKDSDPFFFYLEKTPGVDTCTFHKATFHGDSGVTFKDYDWFGMDLFVWDEHIMDNTTAAIVNKDGCAILTYRANTDNIRIVRFSEEGHVLAERLFETDAGELTGHGLVTTPDSLGFRIIRPRTDGIWGYSCFTFDTELNIVDTIENVDQLSYPPVSCSNLAYFRTNPYSGKTYSINQFSVPAYNGNPEIHQDILMSVYDENMVQTHYTWGVHTPTNSHGGTPNTIGFSSSDEVYMAGGTDGIPPHSLYVAFMDQDLNKYGEVYYAHPSKYLDAQSIVACSDGGCLVCCYGINDNTFAYEHFLCKVTLSDFLSTEEAHSHGLAVATAYPNPGKDVLNNRTALQDARVEVYDLNGRLMHGQEITGNITAIPAEAWPAGVYVWKVYISDGGPSTGSGTLVETGKWVKE